MDTVGAGSSDGTFTIYRNGSLFFQKTNVNLNGSFNMSGMGVEAGGTYTKLTGWRPDNSCGASIGDGTDAGPRVTKFNNLCPCSNQCPPSGFVPIFKRYIDDSIVLKKP